MPTLLLVITSTITQGSQTSYLHIPVLISLLVYVNYVWQSQDICENVVIG